jgi:hypothetical protein
MRPTMNPHRLTSFFLHSTVNRLTHTFITFYVSVQSKQIEYDRLCGRSEMSFRRSQARDQGITSGSNAPTTNLDTLARNMQNVKDKHCDKPSKKRATAYCIHMLPLLNCPGWIQLVFKSVCICKMFCAMV